MCPQGPATSVSRTPDPARPERPLSSLALPPAPTETLSPGQETASRLGVTKKDLVSIAARIDLAADLLTPPPPAPGESNLAQGVRESPAFKAQVAKLDRVKTDVTALLDDKHALTATADPNRQAEIKATVGRLTEFRAGVIGVMRSPDAGSIAPVASLADGANAAKELSILLERASPPPAR